ncbi:MAG: hypothetical protein AB1735_03485 [Pseudomonadota bacterium]
MQYFDENPEQIRAAMTITDPQGLFDVQRWLGWCMLRLQQYERLMKTLPRRRVEEGTLAPTPGLYLAENHETTFRVKFQLACADQKDGLSTLDLALTTGLSYSVVGLHGALQRVFDASLVSNYQLLARSELPVLDVRVTP